MHKFDIAAIASTVVGVSAIAASSPIFQSDITTLAGSHAPEWLAAISILGIVGGQAFRVAGSPSGSSSSVQGNALAQLTFPPPINAAPPMAQKE